MGIALRCFVFCLLLTRTALIAQTALPLEQENPQSQPAKAEQLFALSNQARAAAGLRRLEWDPALADAALKHSMRMAIEGPIAHRYGGEASLQERTADAGAHFSLIEENVAVASNAASVHQGWLDSPEHRANLLSPSIDRVGVAVVAFKGVIFAVADYSRAVPVLAQAQVESEISALLQSKGISVSKDPHDARAACELEHGLPRSISGPQPLSVVRWQDSSLAQLPKSLADRIATGDYRRASVGSCTAKDVDGKFTVYRVTVLLFGPPSTNDLKSFY
jgi:hypothetical protein